MAAIWEIPVVATAVAVDLQRQLIWCHTGHGIVRSLSIADQSFQDTIQLPPDVIAIAANNDAVVATHKGGGVSTFEIAANDPNVPPVMVQVSRDQLDQVTLLGPNGDDIAATASNRSQLVLTSAKGGSVHAIAVPSISGIARIDETIWVATNSGEYGRGKLSSLEGSSLKASAVDLPRSDSIAACLGTSLILVTHQSINCVSVVDVKAGSFVTYGPLQDKTIVQAHGLVDGKVLLHTETTLTVLKNIDILGRGFFVERPNPIFIGSWTRIFFSTGSSSIGVADLEFRVPGGPAEGSVSFTRENGEGDSIPLLIAGGRSGTHQLKILNGSRQIVAAIEFAVTALWSDFDQGPPGFEFANTFFAADTSGGSLSDETFDDSLIGRHVGTWTLLVLMVDTESARWPTADIESARADILEHVIGGDAGGPSVKQYFEENSGFRAASQEHTIRGLTIAVHGDRVFGPVSLLEDWEAYFGQAKDKNGNITDHKWSPIGTFAESTINRALESGLITTKDFDNVNAVVFIPRSADNPPTSSARNEDARFVWPSAKFTSSHLVGWDPHTDSRNFAQVFIPFDFSSFDATGRPFMGVLCHELGHTLDLPDLYDVKGIFSNDVSDRLVDGMDMMDEGSGALSNFSISSKIKLGWIDDDEVELVDFHGPDDVERDFHIHASVLGPEVPDSMCKAVKARRAAGWNYYVEYRAQQDGFISDRFNRIGPPFRKVLITDAIDERYTVINQRPKILLVREDEDKDGPLLGDEQDFKEQDQATGLDMKIEVSATEADHAVVKIKYGGQDRPDPSIRPWKAEQWNWQSPDIEIRNDKSAVDSKYRNIPWLGHRNFIVATVRNSGGLDATDVVVDISITRHTLGGGDEDWELRGTVTHDIPAKQRQEFQVGWTPEEDVPWFTHYCVKAKIRQYQDRGDPRILEIDTGNNEARSNYMQFDSSSESPASRVGTEIKLYNPFRQATIIAADVRKTHEYHRVFTEHRWLKVDSRSSRPIKVWDESISGTPQWTTEMSEKILYSSPNRISVRGYASNPFPAPCGTPVLTGGVGLKVHAGRATTIQISGFSQFHVQGQVVFKDSSQLVTTVNGKLLFVMLPASGDPEITGSMILADDGGFGFKFDTVPRRPRLIAVVVHYLGAPSASPSVSSEIALPI